ncbi:MAG: aminoglycoside phosphotransferase family protein [Cyanobacteria bacterium J06631_9]
MMMGTPVSEVEIDSELVRALLRSQHRDLAHLPISYASAGWDNVLFRLGADLAIRLPRRQLGADLIKKEQTWLPVLSDQLMLPAPIPLRVGEPGAGYPWCWSVVPWLPGNTADTGSLREGEAVRFAQFLRGLHMPAPPNAPANSFRGVPLLQRAEGMTRWMASLSQKSDALTPKLQALWQRALRIPATTERRWLHGDLHPRNILSWQGRISGVIDWGDLTAGDVATDLAAIWMLFDSAGARGEAMRAYGMPEALVVRSQGWAIIFAVILLDTGLVDNPVHAAIGRKTLSRLADDFGR